MLTPRSCGVRVGRRQLVAAARPTLPTAEYALEYARIDSVYEQEGLQVLHQSTTAAQVVALPRQDGTLPGVYAHPNEDAVLRRVAEWGVRVLLSGWGGDEGASFNGRGHEAHLLLTGRRGQLRDRCRVRGADPLKLLAGLVPPLVHPQLWKTCRKIWHCDWFIFQSERWLIDPGFARRLPTGC